jgi:hypothetical protein
MSDQAPAPDTITTYEIGVMLGYSGDRARVIRSAGVWLTRHPEIHAVGREPGRGGQSLFPRSAVADIIRPSHGDDAVNRRSPVHEHSKGIAMRSSGITEVTATQTTFVDEYGRTIGNMWEIETSTGPAYVAEAHDWSNGMPDGRYQYNPQVLNVYDDRDQAAREIAEHVTGDPSVES